MFWSKAPTPTDPPAAPATTPTPAPNAAPPPHPPPPAAAAPPLTRDQQADLDLEEILAELDRDHQTHAAAAKHNATTHFADDDKTGLPTDMNCLTAFDEMFYCYSLGGQFLNAYRYGGFRDCSEKSADWRFCIKTKVRGEVASRVSVLLNWVGEREIY